jgi:hypothetical protein
MPPHQLQGTCARSPLGERVSEPGPAQRVLKQSTKGAWAARRGEGAVVGGGGSARAPCAESERHLGGHRNVPRCPLQRVRVAKHAQRRESCHGCEAIGMDGILVPAPCHPLPAPPARREDVPPTPGKVALEAQREDIRCHRSLVQPSPRGPQPQAPRGRCQGRRSRDRRGAAYCGKRRAEACVGRGAAAAAAAAAAATTT